MPVVSALLRPVSLFAAAQGYDLWQQLSQVSRLESPVGRARHFDLSTMSVMGPGCMKTVFEKWQWKPRLVYDFYRDYVAQDSPAFEAEFISQRPGSNRLTDGGRFVKEIESRIEIRLKYNRPGRPPMNKAID